MSRILLLLAHSIAEADDLKMLHEIGHEVFSIGAYTNPSSPADDKRPALPQVPFYPDLARLVEGDQMEHKAHLPSDLIDWADIIIAHHFVSDWIAGQWGRIRSKRVIWRTCGQSTPALEELMSQLTPEGLQIVRYSPKERNLWNFAGEDALIRFGKEPSEWYGWTGEDAVVGNITQDMAARGDACGLSFWLAATKGLPVKPAGPMSQELPGGIGALPYDEMRQYLRSIRVYLYTGTQPASYTLGLIEAMMTGVPVVSIGPEAWANGVPWLDGLFEGHEIAGTYADSYAGAQSHLMALLDEDEYAIRDSTRVRARAIELFGMDGVRRQWSEFLGSP